MSEEPKNIAEYSSHNVNLVEAALVRAWSALEYFQSEIVVVGGLAVYCHTKGKASPIYRASPTLDVDFGIALAADAGQAAPASFALRLAGFNVDEEGRMVYDTGNGKLYVDFLTEHSPSTMGTRNVSDIKASIFPGINRALANPVRREITGHDHHGDKITARIPFSNYGPLLVLKLNAFARRNGFKRAKDVYDILSLVNSCVDGPMAVIESFSEEKDSDNAGLQTALEILDTHFKDADDLGPVLAAEFYYGTNASAEATLRLREDMVTVAKALMEA